MDITAIDRSALGNDSALHRASAASKLLALAIVLTAVVVSWNFLILAAIGIALVALIAASRLDLRLALGLAAYPAMFAAIFAFASSPSFLTGTTIVLKSMTAALAAVALVLTTPYPQIFSQVQRVMPGLAGDALLMTYRTFFLLAGRFGDMLRAVKLRSGGSGAGGGVARTARLVGSALGNLVLYAIELAERDYDVLYVRGYSGRLRAAAVVRARTADSTVIVVAALMVASTALLWRAGWAVLNPFSWLPVAVSLALLVLALVWRSFSGSRS